MKEKIKRLLSRIEKLSSSDKAQIRKLYAEAKMELSINEKCPDCWKDALIALAAAQGVTRAKQWKYVGGSSVTMWMPFGIRLDASTDDETIAKFVAAFPNQKLYE